MGNKSSTPATPETQVPKVPETTQVPPVSEQVAAQISKAEEKAQQAAKAVSAQAHKVEEKAKDAARSVKDTAQNVKETVTEKAKEGADAVKRAVDVQKVEDKAKEAADKAKEAVKDAASAARVSTGSVSGDIHHYLKETRRVTKGYYKEAKHEFDVINQEGPVAIANFKKNHIFPIDPTTRAVIFYGVTGLSFLVGIKAFGALRAIRNSTVLGLTTGFVVYPEAINPFYRIKKQYTEEAEQAQEQEQSPAQE